MNKYEDKEASMDDYSHERKLELMADTKLLMVKWLLQKMILIMLTR